MIEAVTTARERIVVGVDGTPDGVRVLEWALEEAGLRHADLEVVHVRFARDEFVESYPGMAGWEQGVLDAALAVARRSAPGLRVSARLVGPPVGEALVRAAEGAGLLVVGTRGLSFWQRMDQVSVSTFCVHHARCPVVIVPHADAGPPDAERLHADAGQPDAGQPDAERPHTAAEPPDAG